VHDDDNVDNDDEEQRADENHHRQQIFITRLLCRVDECTRKYIHHRNNTHSTSHLPASYSHSHAFSIIVLTSHSPGS
jgi:hypothetical protein